MAVIPKGKEIVPISRGEHIVKLTEIKRDRIQSSFGAGADGKSDVLIWRFVSKTKDEDGIAEEHGEITPPHWTPNNKTGKMMRWCAPDSDLEDVDVDDDLVGNWYKARFDHETKPNGNIKAVILYMEPYVKPKAEKKIEAVDPFADE